MRAPTNFPQPVSRVGEREPGQATRRSALKQLLEQFCALLGEPSFQESRPATCGSAPTVTAHGGSVCDGGAWRHFHRR